jgi:hypothetical protein
MIERDFDIPFIAKSRTERKANPAELSTRYSRS